MVQNQETYNKNYNQLIDKFEARKAEYEWVEALISDKQNRANHTELFVRTLKEMEEPITPFDPLLWNLLLDYAEVDEEREMSFKFRTGE